MDRNAPITSKDVFPKRSARRLTELKNPKFLWSLQNAQRDTNNLAICRDFFGYSKLIFLFFVLYHFMLPANFYYGSEFQHGILWEINFGPANFFFFWGFFFFFFLSPRDFLGFWFLPSFDHPCYLKSGVPPLGFSLAEKYAEFFTLSIPSYSIFFWLETVWGRAMKKNKPYTVKCI